jgi:hypothetical protein
MPGRYSGANRAGALIVGIMAVARGTRGVAEPATRAVQYAKHRHRSASPGQKGRLTSVAQVTGSETVTRTLSHDPFGNVLSTTQTLPAVGAAPGPLPPVMCTAE